MTKISRILAGAASVAMLGVAAVPMATFAEAARTSTETQVEVIVFQECLIGDAAVGTGSSGEQNYIEDDRGGNTNYDYSTSPVGVSKLSVTLSASTPSAETSGTGFTDQQLIGTVCNDPDGYSLTETMEHTELTDDGDPYVAGTNVKGFDVGAGNISPANFAPNTWSIKYADVENPDLNVTSLGDTVDDNAKTYNRSPNTTGIVIAATDGPTALRTISQQFGAKTNGAVPGGVYTSVIEYTIAGNPTPTP